MQNAIVLTSATLGLTQAFKIAGLPSRYSPIVAIIVGMILHLALAGFIGRKRRHRHGDRPLRRGTLRERNEDRRCGNC